MRNVLILSGLPASGKTTLARTLANHLQFSFYDKDDILETLYSKHIEFNKNIRQQLSRESDIFFQNLASDAKDVVLTSFWRPLHTNSTSGTSSDWLSSLSDNIIEIYCHCDVDVAVERFVNRKRHAGHLDHLRDPITLKEQFEDVKNWWPLGIGKLIQVNSSEKLNEDDIINEIKKIWAIR